MIVHSKVRKMRNLTNIWENFCEKIDLDNFAAVKISQGTQDVFLESLDLDDKGYSNIFCIKINSQIAVNYWYTNIIAGTAEAITFCDI